MAPPAAATTLGQFFSPTETLPAEMARLSKLRREEPETAATIGQFGEKMVALAKAGNMRQLCAMLSSVPEGFMLQWYVVKMFREACDANQVHVVQFMLDNGVPIKAPPLLDTLHNVVAQARKNQAAFSPLLRVLVKGGFDPNYQKPDAYLTALHVACDEDLVDIAQVLIEEGADVNAVAEDDVMPLNCADKVAAQAQGGAAQAGEDKQTPDQAEEALTPMQKLLLSKGAKRTWRKTETSAEALRKQRLQDFYDAEKEAGEGRRTFSGGCC